MLSVDADKCEKGLRLYRVQWGGTDQSGQPWEPTWEPIDNLIGAAAEVKKYRLMREAQDKERKEAVAAERKAR